MTWYYLNHEWRETQGLDHYPVACDFEVVTINDRPAGTTSPPATTSTQNFARNHYWNAVPDLGVHPEGASSEMSCYLVQEEDGTSRFILEDGIGFILLEFCDEPPPFGDEPWRRGGDRRLHNEVIRRRQPSEDEMMLISVILSES